MSRRGRHTNLMPSGQDGSRCVLAVIDVSDATRSAAIVNHAAKLAKQQGARLHVATAYPTIAAAAAQRCQVVRFLPALDAKSRDRRRCAVGELLRRLHVDADAIHVEAGTAEQIIEKIAANLHPSAIVGSFDHDVSVRVGDPII